MTGILSELIELVERVNKQVLIPPVREVFMPEPNPAADKDSEFGIVVLEDDSAGLYYAWMGAAQQGMNERYQGRDFRGAAAGELVSLLNSEHEADRSLGLAAVNAVSMSVFRQADCVLPTAVNSMGELDLQPGDHLGMIGYFPSLLRRLQEQQIRVTVIERKQQFVKQEALIEVTLDASALANCNKILSTASTLLNNSLDEILGHCRNAEVIVVVGPTAGFLPDVLFKRGVKVLGGAQIVDARRAINRIQNEQGLGDTARKYALRAEEYAGVTALLARAAA